MKAFNGNKADEYYTPEWVYERLGDFDNDYCAGEGIMLLPASASTPWFGPLAAHCGHVFFLGRKVNFAGGRSSNFGGSVLFPFGEEALQRLRATTLPGYLARIEMYNPR